MLQIQPYVKPSLTGVSFVSGPGAQQPAYDGVLSYLSDVMPYALAIGATVHNPINTPQLNVKVSGVNADDAAQPWIVQFPGGQWAFAGTAINQQVDANGGGTVYTDGSRIDGSWSMEPSGVWIWTMKPIPIVAAPAPVPQSAADLAAAAASFAEMEGATTLTTQQFESESLYYLRALGALAGVPAFKH